MSSEGTANSPDSSPKRHDWAEMNQQKNGGYGTGPSLQDPDDTIANSDAAYHVIRKKLPTQLATALPLKEHQIHPATSILNTVSMLEVLV